MTDSLQSILDMSYVSWKKPTPQSRPNALQGYFPMHNFEGVSVECDVVMTSVLKQYASSLAM